jgi:hypothetical protein
MTSPNQISGHITFRECLLPFNPPLPQKKTIILPVVSKERTYILGLIVMVEWLTLLLYIREVPGSNFSLETGYPHWGFSWFPSVPPGECQDCTLKLGHDYFLPIYHSLFTVSFGAI